MSYAGALTESQMAQFLSNIEHMMVLRDIRTNKDLATRSRLSTTQVNRLMRGDIESPTVFTLKALGKGLEVAWWSLIDVDLRKVNPKKITPAVIDAFFEGRRFPELVADTKVLSAVIRDTLRAYLEEFPGEELDPVFLGKVIAATLAEQQLCADNSNTVARMALFKVILSESNQPSMNEG